MGIFSTKTLQAAIYEAMLRDSNPLAYYPLGVVGGEAKLFDIESQHPRSPVDLVENKARLVISIAGGQSPDNRTHGSIILNFSAYAADIADAQDLADTVAAWLRGIPSTAIRMTDKMLATVVQANVPTTARSSQSDTFYSSFTAVFNCSVAPDS